jgi:hypothetical protein
MIRGGEGKVRNVGIVSRDIRVPSGLRKNRTFAAYQETQSSELGIVLSKSNPPVLILRARIKASRGLKN